jgi:hypothetical protein
MDKYKLSKNAKEIKYSMERKFQRPLTSRPSGGIYDHLE